MIIKTFIQYFLNFKLASLRTLFIVCTIIGFTSTSYAGEKYARGWVWASTHNATLNVPYTPPATYQKSSGFERLPNWPFRNNFGGNVTVTRQGTGIYRVLFGGLNVSGGTVQITAYGGNHFCKVRSWGAAGGGQSVNVRCYTVSGALVNGKFTALYYKNGPKGDYYMDGYLWANNPGALAYTPNPNYQQNSSGVNNTIKKLPGNGLYEVTMPNMKDIRFGSDKGGTVMVTAYGAGAEKCKVVSWSFIGTMLKARVRCMSTASVPVNTRFTMSYFKNAGTIGASVAEDTLIGAYAWVNSDTPMLWYQKSYGGVISSSNITTGKYLVEIPNLNYLRSTAQVTAHGYGSQYCSIQSWGKSLVYSKGTAAHVDCYDTNGSLSNSKFTIQYFNDEIILY